MIHIKTNGYYGHEGESWILGCSDYYIYNPFAEALRMYADYLEGIEINNLRAERGSSEEDQRG